MRQQHDDVGALCPRLVDLLLHVVLAQAELPFRDHPCGVRDRRARERLADDGDLRAALLEHGARFERLVAELVVAHVLGEEGEGRLLDDLLDALGAVGELPMRGHGVDAERGLDVDHVLTPGLERGPRALPRIAAVERQHLVGAAFGADRLDDGRDAIHAAHAAIVLRQRLIVFRRHGVGVRRARRDLEMGEKGVLGQMRGTAIRLADAQIDRRLAEIERDELGVEVGDVDERHRSQRVEAQKVGLRQLLLRGEPTERREARTDQKASRRRRLQEVPAADHCVVLVDKARSMTREEGTGANAPAPHATSSLFFEV